jgi:hypothetical protein
MPVNIFINYRRQTDSGVAGRIYDGLSQALPGASIFMDVDKLNPGEDFEEALTRTLESSKVFLAIIGPEWATVRNQAGKPRLDEPADFVRREINVALTKGVRVIPVLVSGAQMPDARTLPDDLKPLIKRHVIELRHERFGADLEALIRAISTVAPSARLSPHRKTIFIAATVGMLVVAASGFAYWRSGPVASWSFGPAWSAWRDGDADQREFDANYMRRWYPSKTEAKVENGGVKLRGYYEPYPEDPRFKFASKVGLDDSELAKLDVELTQTGYRRIWHQRITVDSRGFNQAIWVSP